MANPQPLPLENERSNRFFLFQLDGYQWQVFLLSAMGWMFDTMDQNLFTLSRAATMKDLLSKQNLSEAQLTVYGTWATALFIVGWATGGLIFGKLGDKFGRARTMALTVGIYAICTGLSGFAQNFWQFAVARLITGLGIGGEFAAGAAFVAEVMPQNIRAKALASFQALSAVGNIVAAVLLREIAGWRTLYFVGALPALLAVLIRLTLKESDRWTTAKQAAGGDEVAQRRFGRISELFTDKRLRRNTVAALAMAISGIVGLWGIGFYAPELIDANFPSMSNATAAQLTQVISIQDDTARTAALQSLPTATATTYTNTLLARSRWPGDDRGTALSTPTTPQRRQRMQNLLAHHLDATAGRTLKSTSFILQNMGSICSVMLFGWAATRIGRRPSFFIAFLLGWASVLLTFWTLHERWQVWYLYPILGFGTLAPYGGYALYFPEIFPTRLRTTGTGLCYNVARYLAATGPLLLGKLTSALDGMFRVSSFRIAAVIMATCYLIGIIALRWAPETKGQPLPE